MYLVSYSKTSCNNCPLVSGLFHLAWCFPSSPCRNGLECCSLLRASDSPLYGYITFCLMHLSVDVSVSSFRLLWITLFWTLLYAFVLNRDVCMYITLGEYVKRVSRGFRERLFPQTSPQWRALVHLEISYQRSICWLWKSGLNVKLGKKTSLAGWWWTGTFKLK